MDPSRRTNEVARTLRSLFESGALADAPLDLVDQLALVAGELFVFGRGHTPNDLVARAEAAILCFHVWQADARAH